MRRNEEYIGTGVMRTDVEGRRRKGIPRRRWMDSVNVDLREKGLSEGERHKTWLCGGNLSDTPTPHRKYAVEEKEV